MLDSDEWGAGGEDVCIYTDASGVGLAFWCPAASVGFQCVAPRQPDVPGIFFNEALAVVSALHHAVLGMDSNPRRILIYTDNTNTVDMFNSLRAEQAYNPLLITSVDLLLKFDRELRVFHVPGTENGVADALSRFENARAMQLVPGLIIRPFLPPQLSDGADLLPPQQPEGAGEQ
ncbi:hypothetical protein EV122DRAFT_227239 [Schizophyllum commune]